MKTAIIGAGLVGRAWAISFARAGHNVKIWDCDCAASVRSLDYIDEILPDLAAHSLLNNTSPADVRSRISAEPMLESALADVDYVQENTPENLDTKRDIFARLDAMAPQRAILASSTSALLPSKFTEHLEGRERTLVCHPINPPYLIPAVEVCPSPWTSNAAIEGAASFLRSCGHAPLVMKREIDGFIMNRLQGALLEEAFRLVASGVANVEDIDIGIKDGLALRWSFMGPFETIDLNAPAGVRDYAQRYAGIYSEIFATTGEHVDWNGPVMNVIEGERRAVLSKTELPARQTWRDRQLMALLAHKREATKKFGR